MVSPAQRRAGVQWAREAYRLPERRACRALGVSLSSVRYRSVKPSREPLRARLRELAGVRVSYGYRRLWILLQREGWGVNHKLVQRLYREEGLTLRRRRPKRRRSAVRRERAAQPTAANEQWAMDFVHDTLSNGRTVRVLTVLDVYSRECVALEAGVGFRAADVARILTDAGIERGKLPSLISVDNGTEFTSRDLDHWAYWNRVRLDFSRPGKPTDNPFIEAFNGSLRRECLSQHWFVDLADASRTLQRWREEYNNIRPHSSLNDRTPASFSRGGHFIPGPNRFGFSTT
jgi:putative transposase